MLFFKGFSQGNTVFELNVHSAKVIHIKDYMEEVALDNNEYLEQKVQVKRSATRLSMLPESWQAKFLLALMIIHMKIRHKSMLA